MGDDSSSGSRLRVDVVDADGRVLRRGGLAGWLAGAAPRRARGEVTVALVSDARIRRLNRQYRGIDRATDVLSFPSAGGRRQAAGSEPQTAGGRRQAAGSSPSAAASRQLPAARHLGDIVIARGVAARQAQRARHSPATEHRILALHGLLHLLGYDHERDDGRMARVERRLRRQAGLPGGLIERKEGA